MTSPLLARWSERYAASIAPYVRLGARIDGREPRKSDMTPLASAFREPRIAYLKRTLEAIYRTAPEELQRPAYFSLQDLDSFRSEAVTKRKWNLGAISSVCNLDCEFCYRYGSPREGPGSVIVMAGRALLSSSEVDARLALVKDERGLVSATADLGEDFVNPNILAIWRKLRDSAPHEVIETTTHGGFLTEPVIRELADLKPVDLCVSLNSSDPEVRRRLMKDKTPEVAIGSLPLLARHRIRYSVSIVAWPTLPLDDLRKTILYAVAHDARVVRVQLPGRTRFHPSRIEYDRVSVWNRIVTFLREMQRRVETPIYWQPFTHGADAILPEVTGAVVGSPASEAGIRPCDIILEIDGQLVGSRERARALLVRAAGRERVSLVIARDGRTHRFSLLETERHRAGYPYRGEGYGRQQDTFGIFLNQGLHVPSIAAIAETARLSGTERTLCISSPLVIGNVRDVFTRIAMQGPGLSRIDVIAPKARYFGGDIILGDLLVFEDIAEALEEHAHIHGMPDAVVIPETMTEAACDLQGIRFDSFNKRIGGIARLAPHPRILD